MAQRILLALYSLVNWCTRLLGGAIAPKRREVNEIAIGLNEKSKFRGQPPVAKSSNFNPRLYKGRLELSSYCVDGLDDAGRWTLLDRHSNKPPIPARTELDSVHVYEAGLALDPNWDPERHVNVIGWPDQDDAQKSAAQLLHACQRFSKR